MDIMAGGTAISANNSSHEIQGLSFASNHGTGDPSFAVNLQDHDHLAGGDSSLGSTTTYLNPMGVDRLQATPEDATLQDSATGYLQYDEASGSAFASASALNPATSLSSAVSNYGHYTINNQLQSDAPQSGYSSYDPGLRMPNAPHTLANLSPMTSLTTQANLGLGNMAHIVSVNGAPFIYQPSANGVHGSLTLLEAQAIKPASPPHNTIDISQLNSNLDALETATSGAGHAGQHQAPNLTYASRVSHTTIAWLISNYETAEGVSLPRKTLYGHYQSHCKETNQEPVNAASFGKLIRSVFLGLRTRRIGTRGNSKYHYYGIRVKADSPLMKVEEMQAPPQPNPKIPNQGRKRPFPSIETPASSGCQSDLAPSSIPTTSNKPSKPASTHSSQASDRDSSPNSTVNSSDPIVPDQSFQVTSSQSNPSALQHLGAITSDIEGFPLMDDILAQLHSKKQVVDKNLFNLFANYYHSHCKTIVDVVVSLNFSTLEKLWIRFWRPLNGARSSKTANENVVHSTDVGSEEDDEEDDDDPDMDDEDDEDEGDDKDIIIKSQLKNLIKIHEIQKFIEKADYAVYQKLVNFFFPEVMKTIPNALTQAIRTFAKSLEGWMEVSLKQADPEFKRIKIVTVKSLSQTLRRYTCLNHLAQAARAVLVDPVRVTQMFNDLNKVDFANVQEQAAWVCQCDSKMFITLERECKSTLQNQASLEKWTEWLNRIVDKTLGPYENKPEFTKAARQLLLRWSYYSCIVVRDLTLRSAESFGSFHLIRLLYDEYMFYEVQQRVARVLKMSPVAVMGLGIHNGLGDPDAINFKVLSNDLLQGGIDEPPSSSSSEAASNPVQIEEPKVMRPKT
ncbi:DNA-binding protein RFX2-like isoform X2 [Tigriopus californicus]|nr:DNA-binding protein RFX2-like isoform X2 [Tigriopus californicus]